MLSFSLTLSIISTFVSDSYVIDDTGGLGRVFDGFGAISGGGATSKLLVNYPAKQRNEILDFLFKPSYGASLDILKVEIGSDVQSTEGTEATHMRSAKDENYHRGYEWWMMKEAKKRNPNIKLYGLAWGWPGWLGEDVFADPDQTAMYIVKWILGANSTYGLDIDYIGLWNERMYNITYIKTLRKALDRHGLQNTHIIAADFFHWTIADDILADPDLARAIYAIGVHYPKTESTSTAVSTEKPLWASEDQASSNNGHWNRNYVNGNMTCTIAWPVVASYYPGLPYYPAGLMTASEPWSGFYPEPKTIWLPAHTTQFTEPGWTYLRHGSGVGAFKNGGTYVTLVSGRDVTIVIETINQGGNTTEDQVKPQNVTFTLKGNLASTSQFNVWYTSMDRDVYFMKKQPLKVLNGEINLQLGVNEMYTLTTLTSGTKGEYSSPPTSKPFPLPLKEDFESYNVSEEPFLFTQQVGAFEVAKVNGSHGKVMRQVTPQKPVSWCIAEGTQKPITLIGNINWTDMYVEADFQVPDVPSKADGVIIASRVTDGGCAITLASALMLELNIKLQTFKLTTNFLFGPSYAQGNFTYNKGWNTASLLVQGSKAVGTINEKQVFSTEFVPPGLTAGFVGLGTLGFGMADFDNVKIISASDAIRAYNIQI